MNNMQKWKAGWTGPDQKIKYRKAASREEIDDLVFLSRVISVIAEDDCTEFIFLECDLVSFISVMVLCQDLVQVKMRNFSPF